MTPWTSLIAQLVKNPPAMQETRFDSWVGEICWRRDRLPTLVFLGFPCGSAGKEDACNDGDLGLTSLAWDDPLEKGKATHSSTVAWRIALTELWFNLWSENQVAHTAARSLHAAAR